MSASYVLALWLFLGALSATTRAESNATDYCKFDSKHILCGSKDFSSRCGDTSLLKGPTISESAKEDILKAHNQYRNAVAGGLRTVIGGRLPLASDMEELIWDAEMEALAAAYTKECLFAHSCTHCAQVERYYAGESLHLLTTGGGSAESLFEGVDWDDVVKAWTVDEERFFHVSTVKKLTMVNSANIAFAQYGHLSQSMWAQTKSVGCGRVVFRSGNRWSVISVCHYGPSGNTVQNEVYKEGKPCSQCVGEGRKCSSEYSNLCSASGRGDEPSPPIYSSSAENVPKLAIIISLLVFWLR